MWYNLRRSGWLGERKHVIIYVGLDAWERKYVIIYDDLDAWEREYAIIYVGLDAWGSGNML